MPIIHGYSEKSLEKNVETEIKRDHPVKQAEAISYEEQRLAHRKMVEEKSAHMKDKHSHPPKKDMK